MNYLTMFKKKAKEMLGKKQYQKIHHKAHSAAGGMGRLKKISPTGSQVHVPSTGEEDKVAPAAPAPILKPKDPKDPPSVEGNADMMPPLDNLDVEVVKDLQDGKDTDGDNDDWGLQDLQDLVEGMDYELADGIGSESLAHDAAYKNLETDPDYYRKKIQHENSTSDELEKSLKLDLGSGMSREPGHIGYDIYPYDHGTIVHDLNLGIPAKDGSATSVRMIDSMEHMDLDNANLLLQEIHRVLRTGGSFTYEGPEDIYHPEEWKKSLPGFALVNHTHNEVQKDDTGSIHHQEFEKVASPDPATANDAEPRVGIRQYDGLPPDAILAANAMDYYWSDMTSSGHGNRLHVYPSQGALVNKDELTTEGRKHIADSNFAIPSERKYPIHDISHARNALSRSSGKSEESKVRSAVYRKYPSLKPVEKDSAGTGGWSNHLISEGPLFKKAITKTIQHGKTVKIVKADQMKQIVYGVVLEPDEIDFQDDTMTADEIEKAAHRYLLNSRVVASGHEKAVKAAPVESFIAPQDFNMEGQNGPQLVKKGSWVLGVKITDPDEWKKVISGEYTGFSVGGYGKREAV